MQGQSNHSVMANCFVYLIYDLTRVVDFDRLRVSFIYYLVFRGVIVLMNIMMIALHLYIGINNFWSGSFHDLISFITIIRVDVLRLFLYDILS